MPRTSSPGDLVVAAAVAVVLTSASACGASDQEARKPAKPDPVMYVAGQLVHGGGQWSADECDVGAGYEDITQGAQVTVYDAADQRIAQGALRSPARGKNGGCAFPFLIPNVPAEGDSFSVEVAERGKFAFKKAESRSITLTLD